MRAESNEMTINTIDDSQRAAAKIAGISFVLSMIIVVFANYVCSVRSSSQATPRRPRVTLVPTKHSSGSP